MAATDALIMKVTGKVMELHVRWHPLHPAAPYQVTPEGFRPNLRFQREWKIYFCLILLLFSTYTTRLVLEFDSELLLKASLLCVQIILFCVLVFSLICLNQQLEFCLMLNEIIRMKVNKSDPEGRGYGRFVILFSFAVGALSFSQGSVALPFSGAIVPENPWSCTLYISKAFNLIMSYSQSILFEVVILTAKFVTCFMWTLITTLPLCFLVFIGVVIHVLIPTYGIVVRLAQLENARPRSSNKRFQSIMSYRQIQILCIVYNKIHQHVFMPVYLLLCTSIFTVCTYVVLVSAATHRLEPTLAMFIIPGAGSCPAILFCLYFPSKVYSESCAALERIHRSRISNRGEHNLLLKRYRSSLGPIRIGFAFSNYIESLTPLKIIEFCIDKVVTLFLLDVGM